MTTPQRALDLAKKYEMLLISRDTEMFAETAAILRHYAEIMQAEPVAYSEIEQAHANRYRVVEHNSGYWPYCVVAGTGTQKIYVGTKAQCERVARSLQCAFLDGAFAFEQLIIKPAP